MKDATGTHARLAAVADAAPPMVNGELLFEAPWEARAFGMAHRLCDAGHFPWERFRDRLIEEIRAWDRAHPDGAGYRYYERWLAALERTLADAGLAGSAELAARGAALASRPHDHDH